MLENLKLRRSTYILFIVWGVVAFFVAAAIFKVQPLTVNFSINDRRLLQGLLRGLLLLLAYVIFTIIPARMAIVIPSFFLFRPAGVISLAVRHGHFKWSLAGNCHGPVICHCLHGLDILCHYDRISDY